MNRTFFIIFGAVIILLLIAVWVYLMFLAPPGEREGGIFANLNFGDTTDQTVNDFPIQDQVADTVVDTTDPAALRQLTTNPVLAYSEMKRSSTTNREVRYVEAGTGHVYSIDLITGETTRLSATTIPVATKASMSPNGTFVMMRSGDSYAAEHVIGFIDEVNQKLLTAAIDETVVDFVIPNNEEALYGVQLRDSYVAKRYDLASGAVTTLFTIPFREVSVAWGEGSSDTHYAYPKATRELEGFAYKVVNGTLARLPITGYGLSLVHNGDTVVFSRLETSRTTQAYVSYSYDTINDDFDELPFSLLPEKCSAYAEVGLICGTPLSLRAATDLPDSWYQGTLRTADYLWTLSPTLGSARSRSDLTGASGREIDVVNIKMSPDEARAYFTDRHNQFLWTLDLAR